MDKIHKAVLFILGGIASCSSVSAATDTAIDGVDLTNGGDSQAVDLIDTQITDGVVESTAVTGDDLENTLNGACAPSRTLALPDFCSEFVLGGTTSFAAALAAMSPDQLGAQAHYSNTISASQRKGIKTRLRKLRVDNDRASSSGVRISGGAASAEALLGKGLAVFGTFQYNDGDRDKTSAEEAYDWSATSLSLGGDYRIKNNFIVGGIVGISNNDTSFASNRGSMDAESLSLAAYGSYYGAKGYLDWMLTYGDFDYTTSRHVLFLAVDTTTVGVSEGDQWGLNLSGGTDFFVGDKTVSPYLGFAYVDTSIDSYTEQGGGSYSYIVAGQDTISSVSNVGVRISQAKSYPWGVLSPSAHLEWLHEFRSDARTINSSFAIDPSLAFNSSTDDPDRSYFNVGVAVSATMPGGRSAFLSVSSVLKQQHVSNVVVSLGARAEF
ncbi:autotransporter outer membrane beta-barrel domain-containing protein [Pseudomonadota bacterium]